MAARSLPCKYRTICAKKKSWLVRNNRAWSPTHIGPGINGRARVQGAQDERKHDDSRVPDHARRSSSLFDTETSVRRRRHKKRTFCDACKEPTHSSPLVPCPYGSRVTVLCSLCIYFFTYRAPYNRAAPNALKKEKEWVSVTTTTTTTTTAPRTL